MRTSNLGAFLQLFFARNRGWRWLLGLGALISVGASSVATADESSLKSSPSAEYLPTNQHPLALLRDSIPVESARVVSAPTANVAFAWSNTLNDELGSYLFDCESRVTELSLRYPVMPSFEALFSLPVVWRGGGFLDQTIEEWDGALGYDNERSDNPSDRYRVEARTREGEWFELPEHGTALGAAVLGGKYRLLSGGEEGEFALLGRLRLPTAAAGYGAPGIDTSLGLVGEWSLSRVFLRVGGGGTVLSENEYRNLRSPRVLGTGYLTVRVPVTERLMALVGLLGHTSMVENVVGFPSEDLSLDVGGEWRIDQVQSVSFFVRENPLHPADSTDVSFLLNWVITL